jgi:hypothetical protein
MKKQQINIFFLMILVIGLIPNTSCKKNYTNPGSVPIDQLTSPQVMTGVVTGLQRFYTAGRSSSLYNRIALDGLLTTQLVVLNQGNTSEYQLQLGAGSVDGTNTILGGLWTTSNKIIFDADKVIANAANLGDKAYASGIIAYATIFKALALGDMAMFWEKIPAGNGQNVTFVDRADGFTKAITAINDALAAIGANPMSTAVINNLPTGISIENTLHAIKARYSLFTGNYAQAITEANAASLTVPSTFNFTSVNLNPIFETATSTNNVYAPTNLNMGLPAGLQPDPADQRVPFYISTNATAPIHRVKGFGVGATTPWPVYLPGEMILIKAEAYARMSTPDLVNALIELNKVVTKTPGSDIYGVGAALPPAAGATQAQVLELIYKHRSIELFMSGLRFEDMRRFGRPNAEKRRNFLPYPFLERDNNINTPPDPSF